MACQHAAKVEHVLLFKACSLLGLTLALLLAALLPGPLVLHFLQVCEPLLVVVVIATQMLLQLCYRVILLTAVLQKYSMSPHTHPKPVGDETEVPRRSSVLHDQHTFSLNAEQYYRMSVQLSSGRVAMGVRRLWEWVGTTREESVAHLTEEGLLNFLNLCRLHVFIHLCLNL
jgi:hypothetical protein